ncbi:MAG TPA: hypothetical protein VFK58_03730, partial [Sphingomicrobium sp.]|nr:hypothetical protein [Sphingomicrobium sp.]
AGAPASAVSALAAASEQVAQQLQLLRPMTADPAQAAAASRKADEIRQLATRANAAFASALLGDAEAKAQRLAAAVPWANPMNEGAARTQSADRQQIAGTLRTSLAQMRSAVDAAARATTPAQSLDYARLALTQAQSFTAASLAAYNRPADTAVASAPAVAPAPAATKQAAPATASRTTTKPAAAAAAATNGTSSATTLSPAKIAQLNSTIDDARNMAKQVISMGRRNGTDAAATQTLKANAKLARDYDSNLATLKAAARGVTSDREADRFIGQAKQTRAYVQFLLNQSSKAVR